MSVGMLPVQNDPMYGFPLSDDNEAAEKTSAWLKKYYEHLPKLRKSWRWCLKTTQYKDSYVTLDPHSPLSYSREEQAAILARMQKKTPDELKELGRLGVPHDLRGLFWYAASGACERHREASSYYAYCLSLYEKHPASKLSIMRDVDRTFPEHPLFRSEVELSHAVPESPLDRSKPMEATPLVRKTPFGQQVLIRVLGAYSSHNAAVGYCQSLNFLAGMLILVMDEERAFWTLLSLLEVRFSEHAFDQDLFGLRVQQVALQRMLDDYMARISRFLKATKTDIAIFSTSWFLCAYFNVLPFGTVLRVWDDFVVEGRKVLFRVGLALFKMGEARVIELKHKRKDEISISRKERQETAKRKGSVFEELSDNEEVPPQYYAGEMLMILRDVSMNAYDDEALMGHVVKDFKSLSRKAIAEYMSKAEKLVTHTDEERQSMRDSRSTIAS